MEDIRDNLPDRLKCPICFEIPSDKVFQCKQGHTFCESCYEKFVEKRCPECRVDLPQTPIRCRALEQSLDSRDLEFPCQFQSAGCEAKLDRKEVAEHISTCKYDFEKFGQLRNVCGVFGFKNCSFKFNRGNTDEALGHFQTEHGMRYERTLLLNPLTIQYEDFQDIFNASETSTFTPILLDQAWWGHRCVYIIVTQFNQLKKSLQFIPFYLIRGSSGDIPKNSIPEQVSFFLGDASASLSCHNLLNCEGLELDDIPYFTAPLRRWFDVDKPFYSTLLIRKSESNTLPVPKERDDLVSLIKYRPCDILTEFLLNKRWPSLIRQVCSGLPQNWDEIGWVSLQDFEDCRSRFSPASLIEGKVLICRANINEEWLIGRIRVDDEMNLEFPALFSSPIQHRTFRLDMNFEILYTPPSSFEWVKWADLKGKEPILVHEEEEDLLILELRKSSCPVIMAFSKNKRVKPEYFDNSYILVLSEKGDEIAK